MISRHDESQYDNLSELLVSSLPFREHADEVPRNVISSFEMMTPGVLPSFLSSTRIEFTFCCSKLILEILLSLDEVVVFREWIAIDSLPNGSVNVSITSMSNAGAGAGRTGGHVRVFKNKSFT